MMIAYYSAWGEWNQPALFGLVVAGAAAVNWLLHRKPFLPRKWTIPAGNCFLLALLLLLAVGRVLGGEFVSYTLAICTAMSTVVLSLHPLYYSLCALLASICEWTLNLALFGFDFIVGLYYGIDAVLIFVVASCLNFFFSFLRYRTFDETDALKKESATDAMTGLYNRKYFEHYFRFHHREDELSALIHMDLDNFKTLNNTLGHKQGDMLLIQVADILRQSFRKTDCVARVGGDEFMVFLPNLSETRNAVARAQGLLERFPIVVQEQGVEIAVSISIGIAFSEENKLPAYQALYEMADAAMYQAKKAGKGRAVISGCGGEETIVLETPSGEGA